MNNNFTASEKSTTLLIAEVCKYRDSVTGKRVYKGLQRLHDNILRPPQLFLDGLTIWHGMADRSFFRCCPLS